MYYPILAGGFSLGEDEGFMEQDFISDGDDRGQEEGEFPVEVFPNEFSDEGFEILSSLVKGYDIIGLCNDCFMVWHAIAAYGQGLNGIYSDDQLFHPGFHPQSFYLNG